MDDWRIDVDDCVLYSGSCWSYIVHLTLFVHLFFVLFFCTYRGILINRCYLV